MAWNALSASFEAGATLTPDVKMDPGARNINLQNTRAHSATAQEGYLQTGAIREECANYKELVEQARMPDVSVCASISAKSRHLKLWLLAQGDQPPQTDIC